MNIQQTDLTNPDWRPGMHFHALRTSTETSSLSDYRANGDYSRRVFSFDSIIYHYDLYSYSLICVEP